MPALKKSSALVSKISIRAITLFITFFTPLAAQEAQKKADGKPEDIVEFMEEGMKEIGYYSLEELLSVEVEVASLFAEDELVVGSTVSSITSDKWKMMGAKRFHEALGNEMSVVSYPMTFAPYMYAIRGYAQIGSDKGIALMLDGVPLTDINYGTAIYAVPNWELGTLNRIEIIKGPGSAIYGSDAFHGVFSIKSFESDKDYYSIEGAGAYPWYGDGNVKISQGFAQDRLRVDFTAGASYQAAQELEYKYDDPNGNPEYGIQPDSGTGTRENKYHSESGIIKLRAKPADKVNLKVGGYFNNGKYENFPGVVLVGNPISTTGGQLHTQDNDLSSAEPLFMMGNGSADYTFAGNISVEASGYYWQSDKKHMLDIFPKDFNFTLVHTTNETVNRYGSQVIIKQPDNALNLQWLIAYSYTKMSVKSQEISARISDVADIKVPSLVEGYSRNINSAFGQVKWGAVKNRLYLVAGGRNDYYSDFGNQVTPRGGVIFLPIEKSSVKALYGRAFRAPCAVEQKGREGMAKGNNDLKPEIIDIYELIYMYKEKKWKASINTFYSRWKNAITLEENPDYTTDNFKNRYVNKGKNDSFGGEAQILYPIEPITFDLGFSYVKSRAIDVHDPEDPSRTTDLYYSAFPEYSVNAGIYFTLRTLNLNFYLNNILYLNMIEVPKSVMPDAGELPPYWRMDINASKIISEKLELYLNVRNVLNRENRMPSVIGAEDGYVEPGISVLLRAGYKL